MSRTHYVGCVDAAGGGGTDSMALCIAHAADDRAVIDAIREAEPPFDGEAVTTEFCALLRTYRVDLLWGDKWGGAWIANAFRRRGQPFATFKESKSELYRVLMPLVTSARIDLLDHPKANAQLQALRRMVAQRGREVIDHPSGAHDDVANVIAGCVFILHQAGLGAPAVAHPGGYLVDASRPDDAPEEEEL